MLKVLNGDAQPMPHEWHGPLMSVVGSQASDLRIRKTCELTLQFYCKKIGWSKVKRGMSKHRAESLCERKFLTYRTDLTVRSAPPEL